MTDHVADADLSDAQAKALYLINRWIDSYPRIEAGGPSYGTKAADIRQRQVGPLFDHDYYIDEAAKAGFCLDPGDDAILHWARHGAEARIVPTLYYDEDFYLAANPDVADAGLFGFLHYLEFGIREGRIPLRGTPLVRKLLRKVPLLSLKDIRDGTFEMRPGVMATYSTLLHLLFSPKVYLESRDTKLERSDTEAFQDFLADGLADDRPFSLLFDARVYAESARRAGFPRFPLKDALSHWLSFGIVAHISPTGLFDEAYYLRTNQEASDACTFGFIHWLYFGRKEGRRPNDWIDLSDPGLAVALKLESHSGLFNQHVMRTDLKFPSLDDALPNYYEGFTFFAHVIARLHYFVPAFEESHANIIVKLFAPSYYASIAEIDTEQDDEQLLYHFLSEGIWNDIAPSPLFESAYYLLLIKKNKQAEVDGIPPFLDWLIHGRVKGLTPTSRFDANYYLNAYQDVRAENAFEHYALYGIWENRAPNSLFSPHWYSQELDLEEDPNLSAYVNYLSSGARRGRSPSLLASALSCTRKNPLTIEDFDSATLILNRLSDEFTVDQIAVAIHLFVSADFAAVGDEWSKFIDFITILAEHLDYSSPLFDGQFYRERAAEAGFPLAKHESAILHFLRIGRTARIVPTRLFDESYYIFSNPDLINNSIWSFEHFIKYGIFERRRPNRDPALAVARILPWRVLPIGARNRTDFWQGLINPHLSSDSRTNGSDVSHVNRVLSSELMTLVMERARALEPQVGDIKSVTSIMLAPQHDVTAVLDNELRSRLKHDRYDTILCIPWIRTGGADLVACQVAECMLRIRKGERILLLQTDHAGVDRPDWAPKGVELVDISDFAKACSMDVMQRLLYTAFVGLSPRRIINVNSRLCWKTFVRFGKRMAEHTDLYAYLFCWDHTAEGLRAGYPSDFFADAAQALAALFTDTVYLKSELSRIYMLPSQISEKIIPLFSPGRSAIWDVTAAELGVASSATRDRPRILWAGRLDRQKRFDLVLQIAQEMPEVDFMCWGSPMLDTALNFSLPPNLTLTPSFKEIDELPLGQSDVWLFTSEWEGLPTILIELANRGMPIVASSVGGVPELIRSDMGWLIGDIEKIELYVAALREAIDDPDKRIDRARRLRDHAGHRHSVDAFGAALDDALVTRGSA